MTQTLQQQVVVQPALQPTVTSSNDEKHLKIIKRISVGIYLTFFTWMYFLNFFFYRFQLSPFRLLVFCAASPLRFCGSLFGTEYGAHYWLDLISLLSIKESLITDMIKLYS